MKISNSTRKVPRKLVYGYDPEAILPDLQQLDREKSLQNIIDFGAGNGVHAIDFARHFPKAEVLGIEPNVDFYNSCNENLADENLENLKFLNYAIEDYSASPDRLGVTLIHCCMVFPFLTNHIRTLELFNETINDDDSAIITLFIIPPTYSIRETEAAREYMSLALPTVSYFPKQVEFEMSIANSGFEISHKRNIPLPSIYRGDDVEDFKKIHQEKRLEIDLKIREQFNLTEQKDLKLSPVKTYFIKKKSNRRVY